jgi:pimeloyl-ACP methyl ester carboxylesterase
MKLLKKILLCAALLAALAALGFWARPVSYFKAALYLRESRNGIESHTATVEGLRVHYLAEGPKTGPVVVLVHGLSGSAEDWRNLAPSLAQAGYRVYMPDLPGFGRSEQPRDFSYSVQDQAEVVMGFLQTLGLRQVDLGGWSMGGWIAQLVAAQDTERIRRLMLFDSVGLAVKPEWDTRLFTPTTPAELDQLDALLMPHPPKVPSFVARDILRVSRNNAWVTHRAVAAMLSGQDATDTLLPKLQMPVLLVWGTEDRITPPSLGEKMHQLAPQSELALIPGCGHLAPGQCTAQIGPKVVGFVKR